ncbi:HU family DNA-binding protein [Endothiovibrio diazotrophicus]
MAVKKKSSVKKAAPVKKKVAVAATEKKATTKAQTVAFIAEETGLAKKDVDGVFEALGKLIKRDLNKRTGVGHYTLPGLAKIKVVRKPATKSRKGVNPFTGEEMTIKAKPAHNVVKVLPLKGLKDMV